MKIRPEPRSHIKNPTLSPTSSLTIRRRFRAPPARVFTAWTDPEQLKHWWAADPNFTTPIAEVDLRIGGRYRLGMLQPGETLPLVTTGIFQEILPPEKLVYTWYWEGQAEEMKTLVTVEFMDRDGETEVVLKHERFTDKESREQHGQGWQGCLDQLEEYLKP